MRGHFSGMNSREVRIDLLGSTPEDGSFSLLTACMVNFGRGNKTYLFLANVIERPIPMSDGGVRLRLSIPDDVLRGEVRRAFRIPIDKFSDLQASLRLRDKSHLQLQPLDIGYVGMRAAFSGGSNWKAEEVESIQLSLYDDHITLPVEIRQQRDKQLGRP